MRHYHWTALGMQETRFAIAEPDTFVKSEELGAKVDALRAAERARAGGMVGGWAARLESRRSWGTAPSWPEVFEELAALRRQIEGGGEG